MDVILDIRSKTRELLAQTSYVAATAYPLMYCLYSPPSAQRGNTSEMK
jgi:hypothetical protein